MPDSIYPIASRVLAERRKQAAPETHEAFQAFGRQVFADGALPEKTKPLIAVAVAQRHPVPVLHPGPRGARAAPRRQRAGDHGGDLGRGRDAARAAYAHSLIALDALADGEH